MIKGPWPSTGDDASYDVPLEPPYLTPIFQGERVALRVDERDHTAVIRLLGPGLRRIITDLDTGKRYEAHGRPCEIPTCYCDAEIIEVTTSG